MGSYYLDQISSLSILDYLIISIDEIKKKKKKVKQKGLCF